jgi:peptidoglycan/LPS O-acetylase OafA/YrhL
MQFHLKQKPFSAEVSSASRLPVLDGLRAISILLVLGAHMLPLGPKFARLNETAGAMGMSLFFALSGFLITSGLRHNGDVLEFMVKRLSRIVPLAYAYSFIVFTFLYFDPKVMLWTGTFLLNYFPQYMDSYNEHFWSLCVEVQFYIAIAVVVVSIGQKGLWIVWPVCLAITALRISQGAYIHIQTHLRGDEILAGACVATLYQTSWHGRARYPVVLIGLAVLFWFASGSPYSGWWQYLRPYATATLLAATLCLGETMLAAFLSSWPMRYIATISYALYVIHPITIHGWWNEGTVFERYLLKRPISFAMTFIGAHISTFYWERPWLHAGRQWIRHRRMRRAQAPA